VSDFSAFAGAERAGWTDGERAAGYVDLFAVAADQAIAPLLNAVNAKPGDIALDLCCGHGNVAQALAARGGDVVGADFSEAMLALARERNPGVTFVDADAQDLPFEDDAFDLVVSNVGVCHVPDQPRALAQARRVMRAGGRFGMTVWCGPDRSPSYELVYRVIKQHGAPGIAAPPGPDFHQFANPAVANALLSAAGFSSIAMTTVECGWTVSRPEQFFDIFARGAVRAAMLLARQPAEHRAAIREAMTHEVRERFANGGQWRVPSFAAVLSARK